MINIELYLKSYQEKHISELQLIKPKWAIREHLCRLLNSSIHPKEKEFSIFFTGTKNLINHSEFYEVDMKTLFTGGNTQNDDRIAKILYRWENNQFIDPPTVGICNNIKRKISFSDGRHRTKLSYFLDHENIPVAIHNSEIMEIATMIEICPA